MNTTTSPMTKPLEAQSDAMTNPSSANTKSETHLSAFEELYANAKFEEAKSYLEKNSQLFSKGAYYYNLGTVRLKLNEYPLARYDFELAKKYGFHNSALSNNLAYTEKMLALDDLSESTVVQEKVVNTLTNIPNSGYVTLTLSLVLIVMLMIRLGHITKKLTIIVSLLLCLVPIAVGKIYVENLTTAVALDNVKLYEGPSKIFNEKGEVKAGSKIVIGETKENWLLIQYPMSLTGWVHKEKLGIY